MIMTDKQIDKLAHDLMDQAKHDLERDGGLEPIIEVVKAGGGMRMMAPRGIPKPVLMGAIHHIAKENNALAVIMVNDGWYLSDIPGHLSEAELAKMLPISKHKDRKEALVGSIIYPDASTKLIFAPYVRDQAAKKITWEPVLTELTKQDSRVHTEQNLLKPWVSVSKDKAN